MDKRIIYLLMLIFSINLAFAGWFDTGTTFTPTKSNVTYYFTVNVSFDNLAVGSYCMNLTGGNYPGSYCENRTINTTLYFPNYLFPEYPNLDLYYENTDTGQTYTGDKLILYNTETGDNHVLRYNISSNNTIKNISIISNCGNNYNYTGNISNQSCYQEFTNISSNCGSNANGNYSEYANWNDGNYSTSTSSVFLNNKYFTYAKPDIVYNPIIRISTHDGFYSYNIANAPQNCLNYDPDFLYFKIEVDSNMIFQNKLVFKCKYQSTSYSTFYETSFSDNAYLTEEAMFWDLGSYNLYPENVTENKICNINISSCSIYDECNSTLYQWYKPQISYTPIDPVVFDQNTYTWYANMYYNNSWLTGSTPNILRFNLNGTETIATRSPSVNGDMTNETFSVDITYPDYFNDVNLTSFWNWTINNNNYPISVTNQTYNQTVINVNVFECNSTDNFRIFNISYKNVGTNNAVNVTNSYDLTFNDGTNTINLVDVTTGNKTYFCTDLNQSIYPYNWTVYGEQTITAPGYVGKEYDINQFSPLYVSNTNPVELEIFLVNLTNVTPITYTWLSTNFINLNGIMKVYSCNNDATKTLIDSVSVVNGQAIINLDVTMTQYSLEFVYQGVTYDSGIWNPCQFITNSEYTYYVPIPTVDILPVIGLFMVDCTITPQGGNVYKMQWNLNDEDPTEIEGCIIGERTLINGKQQVYKKCENKTYGSFLVSVPNNTFEYTLRGEIIQNNKKGYCQDVITISRDNSVKNSFGLEAVFAFVILFIGLVLIFAGEEMKQITGGSIAIIAAWILGVMALNWLIVSTIISLLVVVALIARYWRKA